MANSQTENGCIFLSRSILNSKVFCNEKRLKVWIWCLLKANHKKRSFSVKTGKGETVIEIKRGQFVYGRKSAARELEMAPSTIRNIITLLARSGNLIIKADSHYSIITILNYDSYQDLNTYRRSGKRTGKGQPKDTNNNDKNDNNTYSSFFEERWLQYPVKDGKKAAKKYFLATVKTDADLKDFDLALKNYLRHLEIESWKKPKNGKTFFNIWIDWINWKEPEAQGSGGVVL